MIYPDIYRKLEAFLIHKSGPGGVGLCWVSSGAARTLLQPIVIASDRAPESPGGFRAAGAMWDSRAKPVGQDWSCQTLSLPRLRERQPREEPLLGSRSCWGWRRLRARRARIYLCVRGEICVFGEGLGLLEHGERLLRVGWSRREGLEQGELLWARFGVGPGSGLAEVLLSPLGREPGLFVGFS